MLYIKSFKNYDEFKQIFGVVEHGNGVKSRKNKILLACLKDRKLLKWWLGFREEYAKYMGSETSVNRVDYLSAANMDALKRFAKFMLDEGVYHTFEQNHDPRGYCVSFQDEMPYVFYSPTLRLDCLKGLCSDGDSRAIRYVNTERDDKVFKMKAGKFISKCIEDNRLTAEIMPEQMKRWIGEEFAREWQSYAEQRISKGKYTLHVDDNFSDIYDSYRCTGNFGSCMTDKDYWTFYRDAIDCKAAYLTDEDDDIVARCIVYQEVYDEDGNSYRLAERQYSTDQDDVLKQILVDMLIKAGEIDGYKRVGADCHDNQNFVTNDGESMRDKILHITCHLEYGDTLSYQDSFVYYDYDKNIAYNSDEECYDYELNTTDGSLVDDREWSEYNEEYIDRDSAVFDEYYEDWVYASQIASAIFREERMNICDKRASESDSFCWSSREDAYIYYDECVYIEDEDDYYLTDDCVQDDKGEWRPYDDCVYSAHLDEYIYEEDAVFCDCINDYINRIDAEFSKKEDSYIPSDKALRSDITDDYYSSEENLLEDEKEYREAHALVLTA